MYRITFRKQKGDSQATSIQYYHWGKKIRIIMEWHGLERDPKRPSSSIPHQQQVLGP